MDKMFGGTKFEDCWKLRVHFLEAFRLTLIGRKRQYEGKRTSSSYTIYNHTLVRFPSYWRFLPYSNKINVILKFIGFIYGLLLLCLLTKTASFCEKTT